MTCWLRLTALCLLIPSTAFAQPAKLDLRHGDHICIVGGTVAERMQHFGWLETLISARFPEHQLVFRNLAYSGDEINGFREPAKRMRSMDFGSHDQWLSGRAPCPQHANLSPRDIGKVRENRFELTNTKADVIFAFYGYNESYGGPSGLAKFRENLEAFIQHTLAQQYNGRSAPQLVLFSPIAHEWIDDPNLPNQLQVEESNARLASYSQMIGDVARENQVPFVDLYSATQALYRASAGNSKPSANYTLNGIHQTESGDLALALAIVNDLFGAKPMNPELLQSLRAAVNDKGFYWFNRYRVTDGYSTYGDRAFLKFSEGPGGYGNGLSNYSVAQRELEVLDLLTSNRDQVVWAAAQGRSIKADDSNLPELIPVISNRPGPLEGGKHVFLSGEESISRMTVAKNLKIELFADEAMFPQLINPVQMAFDTKGRLWVATWSTYPHWKPTTKMNDALLILEDRNNDGQADNCITFAGDLHNPTGFEFWGGGVLVAQGPDLLFLKDTDGDDHYDVKNRLLHGFDTADTHHTINSFAMDPGGAYYFQEGTFQHSQIETPWGPPRRVANGAVFRFEPRTQKIDIYVTHGFANPHGHAFNAWGQDIVVDGTGAIPYDATLFASYLEFPNKHGATPPLYKPRTRPCSAIEYLSSSHFPESMRGSLLVGNVIGLQGILQYQIDENGSSYSATEFPENFISSTDPNFRPTDIETAPDGTVYFTDWQNPIIGHMQHNLRDPHRDKIHGRVYRIRHEGRDPLKPIPIAGEPIERLLDLLKEKDDRVRSRVRIELSGRKTGDVAIALNKWTASLDAHAAESDRFLLESLWIHQHHNLVNTSLLEHCLRVKDHHVRAAAVRVLQAWLDRVGNSLDLLKTAASDEAPRVRLQAIWAASFIPQAEAAEVVFIAREHPIDSFLDHLIKETMRTLQPHVDRAMRENRTLAFTSDSGKRNLLKTMSTDKLLEQNANRWALAEILNRPGVRDEDRRTAVAAMERLTGQSEIQIIMNTISKQDASTATADSSLVFDLVRQLTGRSAAELATAREQLEKLAITAHQAIFRQIGFASLISIDGSVEKSWTLASTDAQRLLDFLTAVPLINDASLRATLYDRIQLLLVQDDKRPWDDRMDAQICAAAMMALTHVRGQEAKTFHTLCEFVKHDVQRAVAIQALQRLPRSTWPKEQAEPLVELLIAAIQKVPPIERGAPSVLAALDFADALTTLIPANRAKAVRASLGELGIRVIKLGTVFEKMSFDQDIIAIAAGKPVEFLLENSDLMPHNFVIVAPGTLEEIGVESEARAQQPEFAAQGFVPQSNKVLAKSTLMGPRESQKLSFIAPDQPGVYPFVCTYPGHWRRMYGALYVVADLDGYLADPTAYLAANKIEAQDAALKTRRPRTEWKVQDLAELLAALSNEHAAGQHQHVMPNHGNGKQLFNVANCSSCHKLDGIGRDFGPDLARLEPKWTGIEILKEILDPSAKINDKYQTTVLELRDGKTIAGLVVEETPELIKIVENPLVKAEPTIIQLSDVETRAKSTVSIMPKGLLDQLTRDEILDLVAFVIARGDKNHRIFKASDNHGGHQH